jgi:hypothetical protein
MGFRSILTPEDLKRGDLMEPGWKPVEVARYKEEPADTDQSTNCIFSLKVIDGPEKGNQLTARFNEKALGFGKNFWPLIGIPRTPDGGFECSTEAFNAGVGKKLLVYVRRGKSNKGNEYNEVSDYRPLS